MSQNQTPPPSFDHRVHITDPKTGKVVEENHYILRINADGTTYERPPGSGMIYDPTGALIKDGQKEKRELAAAKAKADAEVAAAKKKAEDDARAAELDAEKQAILAEAKAEAEKIIAEAKSGKAPSNPNPAPVAGKSGK